MSQIKISALPLYTGNTTGVYLVMNNSGETTTYKVTKETLIGSSGTSGTSGTNGTSGSNGSSGTSGSNGTNGSSGTSGTSGTAGSSGTSGVININSPALGRFLYTNATGTAATASVNLVVSGSNVVISGSIITTGSLNVNGSTIITGSILGNINTLTVSSNTASLDLSLSNFFTLQLTTSSIYLNPSNIKPGQTANILVGTVNGSSLSFPSSIKQVSCSVYIPSQSTGKDIITLATFDSSSIYLVAAKNLV